MFRQLAGKLPEGADKIFSQTPAYLTEILEAAWRLRIQNGELGGPDNRSGIDARNNIWLALVAISNKEKRGKVRWDHLIYAYMIENTRIYEIFRRVLNEYLHGEKLGSPDLQAQLWLRNTEELFYRNPPPLYISSVTSDIRPEMRATRRNAYHRMFGMDLTHGTDDNQPYPYIKSDVANNEFITVFEELLREAWFAISNVRNTTGPNPTDVGKIRDLVTSLQHMLLSRRAHGNLSREEFTFVSMMSWFHLTVEYDSPIIQNLQANSRSAEQRLFKVAQRVGLPAHGLSRNYFEIADQISKVLIYIEARGADVVNDITQTHDAGDHLNNLQDAINTIITHWSIITGRDMKARKVATM